MAQRPRTGQQATGKTFHHVTARVFCHATEVEERVLDALAFVVNADVRAHEKRAAFAKLVDRIPTEGHHGNPITILEARLKRSGDIDRAWERLLGEPEVRRAFTAEYAARLDDELALHARFDKQLASRGTLRLASSDDCIAIHAKVAAFPKKRETALKALGEFFR